MKRHTRFYFRIIFCFHLFRNSNGKEKQSKVIAKAMNGPLTFPKGKQRNKGRSVNAAVEKEGGKRGHSMDFAGDLGGY